MSSRLNSLLNLWLSDGKEEKDGDPEKKKKKKKASKKDFKREEVVSKVAGISTSTYSEESVYMTKATICP